MYSSYTAEFKILWHVGVGVSQAFGIFGQPGCCQGSPGCAAAPRHAAGNFVKPNDRNRGGFNQIFVYLAGPPEQLYQLQDNYLQTRGPPNLATISPSLIDSRGRCIPQRLLPFWRRPQRLREAELGILVVRKPRR